MPISTHSCEIYTQLCSHIIRLITNGSTLIYSGVDKKERAKAGVAILMSDDIFEQADYNFISERLIEVNVELKDKQIKVITAYGPNEDASKQEKDDFLNLLQQTVDNVKLIKKLSS